MRGDMGWFGMGEILMFRLLEFAGRPKESTGLCPVPLRTKIRLHAFSPRFAA